MPEINYRQALESRKNCDCMPVTIAIMAITEAAEKSGVSLEAVEEKFDSIADPNCPGPYEGPDNREGCLPPKCMHKGGKQFLMNQAAQISFVDSGPESL